MRFIGKILITALAALVASRLIAGVTIDSGTTAIILALVLALLNGILKPILVFLTIPITILTLGLFLLVINILIILWADNIVDGFEVVNWWSAFWFSILLSIVTAILEAIIGTKKKDRDND